MQYWLKVIDKNTKKVLYKVPNTFQLSVEGDEIVLQSVKGKAVKRFNVNEVDVEHYHKEG